MKLIKSGICLILIVLSFYITDQIMVYVDGQNPIMKEIISKSNNYKTEAVNAIIEDNTIIPGIYGKVVNNTKSLVEMEKYGGFNDNFLIFDNVIPNITIKDNKNKIIIKGNRVKRAVSLIIDNNSEITDYLDKEGIKYDLLSNINTDFTINREYLNGDKDNPSDLDVILNKKKLNKRICLVNYSNLNYCIKKEYYLVKYSIDTSLDIVFLLKSISSGDIIYVNNYLSLSNFKLILSEIKRQDLKIVYLSTLISEIN